MSKHKKDPLLAILLNAALWGSGYLYTCKRTEFGLLLVVAWIVGVLIAKVHILLVIAISVALAYDMYRILADEAEERKPRREHHNL